MFRNCPPLDRSSPPACIGYGVWSGGEGRGVFFARKERVGKYREGRGVGRGGSALRRLSNGACTRLLISRLEYLEFLVRDKRFSF